MTGRLETTVADGITEQVLDALLSARGHNKVVDSTALDADQMVVVAHQIFGEFIPGAIVAADHLLDDPDLLQHREISVHRTLRELGSLGKQVGNGGRATGGREQLDELTSSRCVHLLGAPQATGGRIVHLSEIDGCSHESTLQMKQELVGTAARHWRVSRMVGSVR